MSEQGPSSDQAAASLPAQNKFTIKSEDGGERNFNAKRVTLGTRLRLAKFFSVLIAGVADEGGTSFRDLTDPDKFLALLLRRLPTVLESTQDQYQAIVTACTDMELAYLEQNVELEDLVLIFRAIFKANKFDKTLLAFKGAGNDKKKRTSRQPHSGSKGI